MSYKQELGNRLMNLPVWLLVFYSVITGLTVQLGFSIPQSLTTAVESDSCYSPTPESLINPIYLFTLQDSLFCILYPFAGWFTDVVIRQDKALGLSLWSCWFGTLLQCISYCLQYGTCGLPVNIAKYGISVFAFLFIIIGNSGLFTIIPVYGVHQLFEKPHTHSRAFMHWTVWGIFLGFVTGYLGLVHTYDSIIKSVIVQVTGILIFSLASLAIYLHSICHCYHENIVFLKKDPCTLVYCILKYVWHHKYPDRRSAMTFWECNTPSRLDIGKSKYGGPFTEGDVEDVKTFLRIMSVFICTFGFFIPYYYTVMGSILYINKYTNATADLDGYGSFALFQLCDSFVLVLIPLFQILVIPLYPKIEYFLLNPLKGFIFCYVLNLLSLLMMMALELRTSPHSSADGGTKSISYLYFGFPLTLSGLTDSLSLIFALEFICSQAPSNMKGMLIGFHWFLRTIYTDVGAFISLASFSSTSHHLPSLVWILVLQIAIGIVGLLLFVAVTRWYTLRKRQDEYYVYPVVENVYNRILNTEDEEGIRSSASRA